MPDLNQDNLQRLLRTSGSSMFHQREWEWLVKCAIHNPSPTLLHSVAWKCFDRQLAGLKPNSVWHSLSLINGQPCRCATCRPAP